LIPEIFHIKSNSLKLAQINVSSLNSEFFILKENIFTSGARLMKKIFAGLILISASTIANAGAAGGDGCGWGQALFEGKSGPGAHIMGATTNATSGNNTFGMTSGTNGCSTDGTLTYGGKNVVSSIMDEFSEDVARGNGEALNTVAVVYGVDQQDRATFAKVMHENFTTLFPNENVTADDMMASIEKLMKSDATLNKYVA
jgi:hypothetical protein